MVKTIDQELLFLALVKASFDYSQSGLKKQLERPQRPLIKTDEEGVAWALKDLRKQWSVQIADDYQQGVKTDFHTFRTTVLGKQKTEKCWSLETRNLYSSALAIYMAWDRKTLTLRPELRKELQRLGKFVRFMWNEQSNQGELAL